MITSDYKADHPVRLFTTSWIMPETALPPIDKPIMAMGLASSPFHVVRVEDMDGWLWALCDDDWYWDTEEGIYKTGTAYIEDIEVLFWRDIPQPPSKQEMEVLVNAHGRLRK